MGLVLPLLITGSILCLSKTFRKEASETIFGLIGLSDIFEREIKDENLKED